MSHPDVAVIGGGIIGLAVAREAARGGARVTLLERDELARGASRVAAGMLAPTCEAEFGAPARDLLELGLASARRWPAFAAELERDSGREVGFSAHGAVMLARDRDEAEELERELDLRARLDLPARRLLGSEARELEPALAPGVRLALDAPEDHSVDPRKVCAALAIAARAAGVEIREHAPVREVQGASVTLARGDERLAAGTVVLAAGAWSGELPGAGAAPVRPVKGQALRLRDPAGPGLLTRTVRFPGGYLVPRADGRYVLGGTVEDRGFDLRATAGGARELLREAWELVPGLDELELEEHCVGLRPGTPDNVPLIGRAADGPMLYATGHHRNGVLLTPITADLVGAMLAGEDPGPLAARCDPARLLAAGARA
ncbi:MAG TPA: glycine oxidase ThiO [Solirubrobacteraceae bacterium]|nr:glycine oxidase ThiO [Solirubrobacteraceae bacterium]